jgi:hypothetical protein
MIRRDPAIMAPRPAGSRFRLTLGRRTQKILICYVYWATVCDVSPGFVVLDGLKK